MASDPDFDGPTPKPQPRRRFRLIQWFWIMAIPAILIALFLPAVRNSGEAVRRYQCINTLKQIAMALREYERAYGALPPAGTEDANGRPLHSWRTLILPFLDSLALYQSIDLAKPWDDKANAKALATMPSVYRCPSHIGSPNTTNYLASVGPNACFLANKPRRLVEITSDHASSLMLIEAGPDSAVPWMAPIDGDEALIIGLRSATMLDHPGGTNAAFISGEVQFIQKRVAEDELRKMIAVVGSGPEAHRPDDPVHRPGKSD